MIKNKKVAIFGFAKEGQATLNYLGHDNEIYIFDENKKIDASELQNFKNAKTIFGDSRKDLPKFDYVIRSAGVRPDNPKLLSVISRNTILTSATQIFFNDTKAKIIGVTGTKGKGTTSTLIYEFLKSQNGNTFLAGNIGTPMLTLLPQTNEKSTVVLELSSFQLMDLVKSPHIAVVLMITTEHLDWHKNEKEYKRAKEAIVKYQKDSDFAVINRDFETSKNFSKLTAAKVFYISTKNETNGVYLENNLIVSKIKEKETITKTENILLPGSHNLQNVCAAVAVAKIAGIKNENIKKVLESFRGLIHRLQLVTTVENIKFYNDSFSTTPETTIAAIYAFKEPKILILGGSSKNSNFHELGKTIVSDRSLKALILIGKEAKRIRAEITNFKGEIIENLDSMEKIVNTAYEKAKSGDIVLLSPGCASFDMFTNYEDRGKQFIREVEKLEGTVK